jgi:hypothetical protein
MGVELGRGVPNDEKLEPLTALAKVCASLKRRLWGISSFVDDHHDALRVNTLDVSYSLLGISICDSDCRD